MALMKTLITVASLMFTLASYAGLQSADIPYPFYAVEETGSTEMTPIQHGEEALQLRLDLINKAKSSIDVEYFIYTPDMAGKIFTKELVKAAKRGVKVRILVDKLASQLTSFHAHELKQNGVDIKFYNTSLLLRFNAVNYRNHRKLLVVDGKEAIVGGRNLADEYFNLHEDYNFEDLDVLVRGPLVRSIRDSFSSFFNNELSHYVTRRSRPSISYGSRVGSNGRAEQAFWDSQMRSAWDFLAVETEEERSVRKRISELARKQKEELKTYSCPEASFSSDAPGANSSGDEKYYQQYRHLRKTIVDKIEPVDRALTISSPYFIANDHIKSIFTELLDRNIPITLYTNSLRSTDQIFMATKLYLHLREWLNKGMKVYLHDGYHTNLSREVMTESKKARWGTHSKAHVYETSAYSEVMIGTYNVHNRSEHFNTELAVFCKGNDQFTKDLKKMIFSQAKNGLKVETMIHATDRNGHKINVTGASILKKIKMKLFTIPSIIFSHLL